MHKITILFLFIFVFAGCGKSGDSRFHLEDQGREVPAFSADSAYEFLATQVEFGPRVPNTKAHRQTLAFMESTLRKYAGSNAVYVQKFESEGYDEILQLANVIAAFNPSATKRIMLSAHWDTRPRADEDSSNIDDPISGADDGASGVAVLLELARIMSENNPPVGVDIILFDGEDYGTSGDLSRYFLGSRYWSENPPVAGYHPRFGILLDMVGAKNAQFPKEEYSLVFAEDLVNGIWETADKIGYGNYFLNEKGAAVSDDHVIVNQQAGIPMINIINHSRDSRGIADFAPHWHTHGDNLQNISTETLQAVGDVLVELIYNRIEE